MQLKGPKEGSIIMSEHVCGLLNTKEDIKGLVHPKIKIKSLITHPHAVPTP